MASNVNSVTLSGSLAADPEVKWTNDEGDSIVRLGVIVRKSKKNSDGEYEDVGSIFDVEVFGKFATLIARKLKKFDAVTVLGELVKDEWETAEGLKRSNVKVKAFNIDSQGLYRSKDEDNAVESPSGDTPAETPSGDTADPSSDDIPF